VRKHAQQLKRGFDRSLVPVRELLRDVENNDRIPDEVVLLTHLRLDRGLERLRRADAS
jgi:hypothetical protein